jgi:hypothetical protein
MVDAAEKYTGVVTYVGWESEFDDRSSDEVLRANVTYRDGVSGVIQYLLDRTPVQIVSVAEITALRARAEKAQIALDFDGELDAADNLHGALIDLKRKGADPICIQTIERVMGQIADAYEALGFKEQSDREGEK